MNTVSFVRPSWVQIESLTPGCLQHLPHLFECFLFFPIVVLSVFLMVLEKVPSCDQERQSALDEARQNPREAIFIPDCDSGGLYKAVQCHQSTGYCWCVLVDTGRPIPGTSTR